MYPALFYISPIRKKPNAEGVTMYIKQSELLLGTSMDFVKKFMDNSKMVSHDKGDVLFHENDPANGIIFVKHLAATLGNRLLESYKVISQKPK